MDIKILFIEDDEILRENLRKNYDNETIAEYNIVAEVTGKFEQGIELIKNNDYDIIILDLFKDKEAKDEEAGIKVLDEIRKNVFVPVIFYTGHSHKIATLQSEIVGIVSKGDGIDVLTKEIERIINSKLALIKKNINMHVKEEFRKYVWETIDAEKQMFLPTGNDFSLGYLLLRRLANSLSKENIKLLLGDDKIKSDKVHPMEFYLYPSNQGEYEVGEILYKDNVLFVILTPSCDFPLRMKKDGTTERKVGFVLLAKIKPLDTFPQFISYKQNSNKENTKKLAALITNNQSDRYFFLPGTPFIQNSIIDFQDKVMIKYEDLQDWKRIAKLDSPFAQSMVSSFIRYYNRIGFPDIDLDYILANL